MTAATGEGRKYAALFLAGLGVWVLNTLTAFVGEQAADIACAALPLVWLALAVWLRTGGRWTDRALTSLILAGGFLVSLCFILQLAYDFSWHDLAAYDANLGGETNPDGHLGYIAWIVENGALPTMNPLENGYSILYNPPLYHLIQAAFMRLNLWLGVSQAASSAFWSAFSLPCGGNVHAACAIYWESPFRWARAWRSNCPSDC